MKKGYKEKRFAIGVIYHIFTFCFACVMIYPLVWMVLSSFKDTNEIIRTASELIPRHFSLENYKVGWQGFAGYNFGSFFKNSFVIAGLSTIGAVASSAVIGYGFARINFKFKGFWFACMLLSMMLPFQVVMIPQYIIFNKLGWVGSYLPIIVPQWFGQGFFIFLNIQFIKGIPMDLDEAARMDGCSTYTIFFRIILPLIKPSLVTSAIFSFMWRWDDFLAALLYLSDPLKYPVSYALKMFSDPMTPKPGLVDRRNSGSHTDMDSFTFMSSAASLYPYFEACTRAGRKTADGPAPETFAALRPLGCEAEGEMLAATHGVNTHKGAIFSIGIVCAALGRLDRAVWADPARVLAEVSTMTAGLTAKDFAGVTAENAVTAGQKLYVQYGITGVRGQVEAGLPAVLEFGLPALEKGLAAGYSLNQSGCGALLAIIANSTDTNLIARSDRATQLAVVEELKALLARTPYPDEAALRALDDRFIAANLSPGGSADLLALCYLLHFFKTEVLEDV